VEALGCKKREGICRVLRHDGGSFYDNAGLLGVLARFRKILLDQTQGSEET